jgi:DNA-binding MarR family transcriptional regulator
MDVNQNQEKIFNHLLVMLFNEILDVEHKALITGQFKEISINDMHIIDAIGIQEPRNMSTVAKAMSVTVGTLTTAINSLVKKGYVSRVRSAEDKRVVLLSLTDKGIAAYGKHAEFHRRMVQTVMDGFEGEELDILARAMEKLRGYFESF